VTSSGRAQAVAQRLLGHLQQWVKVVRKDASDARDADQPVMQSLRFLVEIPAGFGLVLRSLCYLAAAGVAERVRLDEDEAVVFDTPSEECVRYSWLGPGFEHAHQSKWEIRLAGFLCLLLGFVFYRGFAPFPLSPVERALLWVTSGALVLEPAWTEVYLGKQS
jgi:hypothetical protein